MTITALMDKTRLPNQLQDQETFDGNMAYLIDSLVERGEQENALAANMSAYAAGGAYSFPYVFDSTTSPADPGPGKLRLNTGGQSNAVALYIDPVTSSGANIDGLLAAIGAGTSVQKGAIRVLKANDPTRWMLFDIASVIAGSGYRAMSVTYRASSSASPFANGDPLMVFLDKSGDSSVQMAGVILLASADITTAVAAINYLDIFTDDYDHYIIDLLDYRPASNSSPRFRFAVGGAVTTNATYTVLINGHGGNINGTSTSSQLSATMGSDQPSPGLSINILNARSDTSASLGTVSGVIKDVDNYQSTIGNFVYGSFSKISGFQIVQSTGNIVRAKIRVYGVRNKQ